MVTVMQKTLNLISKRTVFHLRGRYLSYVYCQYKYGDILKSITFSLVLLWLRLDLEMFHQKNVEQLLVVVTLLVAVTSILNLIQKRGIGCC